MQAELGYCGLEKPAWKKPLVMSIVVGAVEKVPNARNCAVPSKSLIETAAGEIEIASSGSAAGVDVTVIFAVAVTTVAGFEPDAGFVHSTAILVEPTLTPLTTPGKSDVHTWTGGVALLRVQVCVCAPNVLTVAIA